MALPIEMALTDAGFRVDTASTGEAATELLDRLIDDIAGVITDIRLPGKLTGWDVARRARELKPSIPVVYITGDSDGAWEANGVPRSVLIVKPFALSQVTTAISQLMNATD